MEIIGWTTPEQAAEEVWCSIHSSLLCGELLLGYKNIGDGGEIQRLVIVRNKDNSYGVGIITQGYTELLPSVPKTYLSDVLLGDLKTQKLNKQIIETLKNLL